MNIFEIENDYFLLNLNESVGVVNQYIEVGEEIFNALSYVKPKLITPNLYLRNLDNYKIKNDFFIDTVSIKYYSCLDGYNDKLKNGGFVPEYEKEHLNKNGKLINCSLTFFECTDNHKIINKDYFMNVFSHEISHSYRYYSILSTNNGMKSDSINKANSLYGLSKSATSEDEYNLKVIDLLKRIVYLTDKDEISAFVNQTYEEIRQKKYINNSNITKYFGELRMYRETELLKGMLSIFDRLIMTNKGKEACYEFLKYVYGDRFTGKKAIRMFRQKVASIIDYRIEKFLSVVGKALVDFKRNDSSLNENYKKLELLVKQLDIIL